MYSNAPILAVALLSQLVAAQTTTSAPTPSGSSLPDLVDQIDDCVLRCVSTYSSQLGCGATDFACLCQSDPSRLSSAIAPCLFTSGCDLTVAQQNAQLVPAMCRAANDSTPAEVSSASAIVVAAASETSGTSDDDDDNASNHVAYGAHGLLAAMAAFLLA
jgi:hypothetical protein